MARPLLEWRAMDFVFHCASCHGVLIAREALKGTQVHCPHCAGQIEAICGEAVTEAIVRRFLDLAPPEPRPRILRRVRPAMRHSSAETCHRHTRPKSR